MPWERDCVPRQQDTVAASRALSASGWRDGDRSRDWLVEAHSLCTTLNNNHLLWSDEGEGAAAATDQA